MGKGYKLTSTNGDAPKQCAFFLSDQGCRNGANCKFLHGPASPAPPTTPTTATPGGTKNNANDANDAVSITSTESESSGEIREHEAGAYASLTKKKVEFTAPPIQPVQHVQPIQPAPTAVPAQATSATTTAPPASPAVTPNPSEKKKKKRKKSVGENIFDLGDGHPQSSSAAHQKGAVARPPQNTSAAPTQSIQTPVANMANMATLAALAAPPPATAVAAPTMAAANHAVANVDAVEQPPTKKQKPPKQQPPAPPVALAAPIAPMAPVAPAPSTTSTAPTSHTVPPVGIPSFRDLQLPIASFSVPAKDDRKETKDATPTPRPPSPQHEPAPIKILPLPKATPAHQAWEKCVRDTQTHPNYSNAFNFDQVKQKEFSLGMSIADPNDVPTNSNHTNHTPLKRSNSSHNSSSSRPTPSHVHQWFTTLPYGPWCATHPPVIAIDCEMCETKDPKSNLTDPKALCRISVVDATNPEVVLLDTLVKPDWPVVDHRTWVNGITSEDLKDVQFTLAHAQLFMRSLCSDQTVIVGHAVHNDLMALRMEHHCNVDTAMLYVSVGENEGTPSLKNLAYSISGKEMPDVHCSVNDARVALECAKHYRDRGGDVEPVEKKFRKEYRRRESRDGGESRYRNRERESDTTHLLVHRLPRSSDASHISEMFVAYTCIKPKIVQDIVFSGSHGKCHVEFMTRDHADLAYESLVGEEREDKNGKKQKRVTLKNGGYVCVRKMTRK